MAAALSIFAAAVTRDHHVLTDLDQGLFRLALGHLIRALCWEGLPDRFQRSGGPLHYFSGASTIGAWMPAGTTFTPLSAELMAWILAA